MYLNAIDLLAVGILYFFFLNFIINNFFFFIGTGTGLALANIRSKLFNEKYGARSANLGIPKVGVLVTDGRSNIDFPVYFEALVSI